VNDLAPLALMTYKKSMTNHDDSDHEGEDRPFDGLVAAREYAATRVVTPRKPTEYNGQYTCEALMARVRELEARCLDLRSLADQHAHESGLYARRMAQAQSARDKAEARVAELEAAIRVHRDDYHSVGANPEALWAFLPEVDPNYYAPVRPDIHRQAVARAESPKPACGSWRPRPEPWWKQRRRSFAPRRWGRSTRPKPPSKPSPTRGA
jgi:hypothetical protein